MQVCIYRKMRLLSIPTTIGSLRTQENQTIEYKSLQTQGNQVHILLSNGRWDAKAAHS